MADTENDVQENDQTIDSDELQIEYLVPEDVGTLSPFSIGKLTRNSKVLEVSAVLSAFKKADTNFDSIVGVLSSCRNSLSDLNESIKFLLNTRDIANQMIVTQLSTWYYDDNEVLHTYSSLRKALNENLNFSGKINYAADVELTGSVLNFSQRKLVIDLQGHTLSCNRAGLLGIYYGSDITIQNGSIYAPRIFEDTSTEYKFQINRGKLLLKNLYLDFDGRKNSSIWQYRVFNMSQQQNEMLDAVGRAELEFDKDCVVRFHDCNNGECLVCSISPYSYISSTYVALSEDPEFLAKYPTQADYQVAIRPTVTIDGDLKMTKSEEVEVENWPGFIAGTGSDWLETVVNVETHARIFAQEHGIYLGNNGIININGSPTIIAGTGICMRSGKLNIPRDANPTIIGIAEPKETPRTKSNGELISSYYDPMHTIWGGGSDWGTNLRLGHAICLENNGPDTYGKHPVEANIQSGTFISYNNTAIGSYGIMRPVIKISNKERIIIDPIPGCLSVDGEAMILWYKKPTSNDLNSIDHYYQLSTINGHPLQVDDEHPLSVLSADLNVYPVYVMSRPTQFADGIKTDRRESQEAYDYITGQRPDYHVAFNSEVPQLNAVKFENGYESNLSTFAGIKEAVKDILILLGVKNENIVI